MDTKSMMVELKELLVESQQLDRLVIRARHAFDTRAVERYTKDKAVVVQRMDSLAAILRNTLDEGELRDKLYS